MPESEWKKITVRRCHKGNCDVEISYETRGDISNPTILLVMGLNGQGVCWGEGFCDLLADSGYHVIRYDNRDVGFSTKFDHMPCAPMWKLLLPQAIGRWKEPYTLVDMAEDGVALLGKLGIDRAHWVGTSMGGMIVQLAAIHFPEKVKSICSVMSTTMNPYCPEPSLSTKTKFLYAPKSDSAEDIIEFKTWFAKKVLLDGIDPEAYGDYPATDSKNQVERNPYRDGATRHLYAIRTSGCRDEALSKLKCPVGVIHGKKDILVPPQNGVHTAAVAANAHLTMIDEMGHYLFPAIYQKVVDAIVMNCKRGETVG